MARKSRKNIPTVVGSATVQTEVRRPFRAGLYARISMRSRFTSILSGVSFPQRLEKWSLLRRN